jgi:polyisoprenoid-binding protein YceI
MKHVTLFVIAATALILSSFTIITSNNWMADSGHSHLGFTLKHMNIADFHGSFTSWEGKITATKEDLSDAVVDFSGDINSIYTGISGRDEHLQAADFFDAAKYPKFTFKSKSFKKSGKNEYAVVGDLSFHGVTKEITLKAVNTGSAESPQDKTPLTGFKVSGTFNRVDFGISPETPDAFLGTEVTIVADIEFAKG